MRTRDVVGPRGGYALTIFEVCSCNACLGQLNQETVGTKIIADPEKWFQELISEKILIFFAR